jgi:polar amino acid transport system substrate-binding protein
MIADTTKIPKIAGRALSRRALLIAASAAAGLMPRLASAASLDEIKKRGYLVVVTEDDFRPFEYIQDGKPVGYDNALLEKLRKFVPFDIKQQIIPWTGLLAGVSTGKYDIAITAAIITKERQQSLDFSMPIAAVTDYYLKRKDDDKIKSIKDLSGKPLGIQAGSALLQHLPQLKAKLEGMGGHLGEVVQYTSYPEAYQDLAIGRTDFVVNTLINLNTIVKERPDVFAVGEAVAAPAYAAWPVKKGNAELLALIDKFLAQERANGEMAALQKKWLGVEMPDMPTSFTAQY